MDDDKDESKSQDKPEETETVDNTTEVDQNVTSEPVPSSKSKKSSKSKDAGAEKKEPKDERLESAEAEATDKFQEQLQEAATIWPYHDFEHGDKIVVVSGDHKGKTGEVMKSLDSGKKVLVKLDRGEGCGEKTKCILLEPFCCWFACDALSCKCCKHAPRHHALSKHDVRLQVKEGQEVVILDGEHKGKKGKIVKLDKNGVAGTIKLGEEEVELERKDFKQTIKENRPAPKYKVGDRVTFSHNKDSNTKGKCIKQHRCESHFGQWKIRLDSPGCCAKLCGVLTCHKTCDTVNKPEEQLRIEEGDNPEAKFEVGQKVKFEHKGKKGTGKCIKQHRCESHFGQWKIERDDANCCQKVLSGCTCYKCGCGNYTNMEEKNLEAA